MTLPATEDEALKARTEKSGPSAFKAVCMLHRLARLICAIVGHKPYEPSPAAPPQLHLDMDAIYGCCLRCEQDMVDLLG